MQNPNQKPKTRIGIVLPELEGAGDISRWVKEAGYAAREIPEPESESANLDECDLLIVSFHRWELLRKLLKSDPCKKDDIEPNLPLIVCCPPQADLSQVSADELGRSIAFVPSSLDRRLLIFQVQGLLERRRIEQDLRYRLKEREDVLSSISEVFFSVDKEFRYTFYNEKAEKVGGKPASELIGTDMWEAFPFLKNTDFYRQMHQAAVDRQIFISEYLGPITGGWFEMRIYPSAGGLSALFVDISARKKAEETLLKTQEELKEAYNGLERAVEERTAQLHSANERLEELLYSIAHDLRSPLRSMQGFAQAFVEDFSAKLDDRAKDYAKRMTSSVVFMDRMLSDLIELSRVTKVDVHLEAVDLAEAWKSALAQHAENIRSTNALLEVAPALGHATANRTLLSQILSNLLSNALKFTKSGCAPEIKVWTEHADPRFIDIYVEDKGIGIDDRFQEKIFRVFERLNGAGYEGTGIGLAIAKKAAERMKGTLTFTSQPGEGTRFCLRLPFNQGDSRGLSTPDSHGRG
jgi:signal transduction histidine kinase